MEKNPVFNYTDAHILLCDFGYYILYVLIYRQERLTMCVIHFYSHRCIKYMLHITHIFRDIYINTWQLSRMANY